MENMSMNGLAGASKPSESHQPAIYPSGYPSDENRRTTTYEMASNSENLPFYWSENYFPGQESGFREGNFGKRGKFNEIRWNSGKPVDPRLLRLLKFFRELCTERREFFKKIFPGLHDEFEDVFKKIDGIKARKKGMRVQTMQRSLSLGSPRTPKHGDDSTLRLERFRVRTLDLSGVGQGGDQGDGVDENAQMRQLIGEVRFETRALVTRVEVLEGNQGMMKVLVKQA
ncbi:hypothetical protein F0562_032037 [Nyssa sinensis]|uniref:Uncharacterized protein n=1 Tax=Nyssa sinensis TaxID=561372 RepID=A0A5J5AW89_9ASTE|nr:hypothetical protein F0562_032037 [Nyssa sinensis]